MKEEEKNNKLPANYEAKKKRAEWILNDEQQRKEAIRRVNLIRIRRDSFDGFILYSPERRSSLFPTRLNNVVTI